MGVRWAERKSRKLKNLCIFEKKYTSVFVYWHKGKKNHCFGIDAQVYQNEAHEKVENTKIYAFFKVKKKEVYWHKGNKNHRVGIDAKVYQNEAHEKVENTKIYAW